MLLTHAKKMKLFSLVVDDKTEHTQHKKDLRPEVLYVAPNISIYYIFRWCDYRNHVCVVSPTGNMSSIIQYRSVHHNVLLTIYHTVRTIRAVHHSVLLLIYHTVRSVHYNVLSLIYHAVQVRTSQYCPLPDRSIIQ